MSTQPCEDIDRSEAPSEPPSLSVIAPATADGFVRGLSQVVGGPLGSHAVRPGARPGRFWTAARIILTGISTNNTGPGDFRTDTADSSDNLSCPLHWIITSGDVCLSRSSFHPNPAGAADYTARVTSQLPVAGYP